MRINVYAIMHCHVYFGTCIYTWTCKCKFILCQVSQVVPSGSCSVFFQTCVLPGGFPTVRFHPYNSQDFEDFTAQRTAPWPCGNPKKKEIGKLKAHLDSVAKYNLEKYMSIILRGIFWP